MADPAEKVPQSKIVFLNDDITPMEFVVLVLQDVLGMSKDEATSAMLHTHRRGTNAVATMERDKAEAAVRIISDRAQRAGVPFKCILQAAD